MMDKGELRSRAAELPTESGVYQFLVHESQSTEIVLYVGKALDIRNRVRSYTDPRSDRIAQMIDRADAIDVAVTDTETQALLLEANLIKRHQPKYNVRLKDDKSYPLVQLTKHPVPRIEMTRDPDGDAAVFGPFTNAGRVQTVIKALREVYGLRGCSEHKYKNRRRPCLDYEMGLCSAPCTGEISVERYKEAVESVKRFFEGETGVLAEPIESAMEEAAAATQFERAANLRDRLSAVRSFHGEGGEAVSATAAETAIDVIGAAVKGETAHVARLHSEQGKLIDRSQHQLDAPSAGEPSATVLAAFLTQYYAERSFPDVILCSERPGDADVIDWLETEGVQIRIPGAGREAKLVDLALKNARTGPVTTDESVALAEQLSCGQIHRVEGFDVSHAQGKQVVGSNVCFVDGSAEKSAYRRKKLTEGNNDPERMQELLKWRADRAIAGRDVRPDPDLLLIDGGDAQLKAATAAVNSTGWDVPIISLAKGEEIVYTEDEQYDWPTDASYLHLLQRVRDEAHRFAVQYHQTLRDNVETVLEDIPGVGKQTRKALLRRFGSVDNVRQASREALLDTPGVGSQTAANLQDRL